MWDVTQTEHLINLYQSKEALWNIKSSEFKNRDKKRAAWEELAEKLNVTADEIQRKIHNLRNQFNSELKKSLKRKSGDGADNIYIPKWVHFKQLMFLKQGDFSR